MKKQKVTIEIRYNYLIDPEFPDDCDGGEYYSVDVEVIDEDGNILHEFSYGDQYHEKGSECASTCSDMIKYFLKDKYTFVDKLTTKCIEE